jgi:hypothetical protein
MDCINGLGTYVRKAAGSIRRIGVLRMPIVLLITFAVILTVGSAFGQGFLMTQLVVPGAQTQSTYPQGVNVNGAVVGYYTNSSGIWEGFLYSTGTYTALSYPGATGYTRAGGINDSGTVVGDYEVNGDNTIHSYTYAAQEPSRHTTITTACPRRSSVSIRPATRSDPWAETAL